MFGFGTLGGFRDVTHWWWQVAQSATSARRSPARAFLHSSHVVQSSFFPWDIQIQFEILEKYILRFIQILIFKKISPV